MSPPVTIIGMGVSPEDLTERQRSIIAAADILVGGRRLLDRFPDVDCERRVIDRDLAGVGDFIEAHMAERAIVVLASGDPLFFGIGAYLGRRLGADRVCIRPNVSAVAAAFARLGTPWQGVRVVSLHGRQRLGAMLRDLAAGDTVAVYTDPSRDPAWLAAQLLDHGFADVRLDVLEQLGTPQEKIRRLTPEQARDERFDPLNLVVLTPDAVRRHVPSLYPGMPDEAFVHEKGLITKAEVRAVSLSRLRLFDRAVLWDLGAGSGSVAVEAGQFVVRGEIYAVERNPGRVAHIHANRRRFGIGNLTVVEARLPEGIEHLPDPDRIFVGGGGRDLAAILRAAAGRLKPDGRIVVNTVLIDTLAAAQSTLDDLGFALDTIQIQVNRAAPMPFSHRFEAANPVWIVTGSRANV